MEVLWLWSIGGLVSVPMGLLWRWILESPNIRKAAREVNANLSQLAHDGDPEAQELINVLWRRGLREILLWPAYFTRDILVLTFGGSMALRYIEWVNEHLPKATRNIDY